MHLYRDLKPENLVLETDDIESNIKIIDFDTSKICKSAEKIDGITGTVIKIIL